MSEEYSFKPADICILCRTNKELYSLQTLARRLRIRVHVMRPRKIPLTRTREFYTLMDSLNDSSKELMTGKSLESRVEELIQEAGFSANNLWVDAFRNILGNYLGEILDARLPVGNFLDYVYDVSRDTRQFQQIGGDKILLSTMHNAKGMEFPVVFAAGQPLESESREDERRLYYVAMTRAMKRLYCVSHQKAHHPFLRDIAADAQEHVIKQQRWPAVSPEDRRAYQTVLWELELSDVIISFPAYRRNAQEAQALLSHSEPGYSDGFTLNTNETRPGIFHHDHPIARLSSRGAKTYTSYLAQGYRVEKILLLASIRWDGREEAEEFAKLRDIESWYTGLFQIILAKGG